MLQRAEIERLALLIEECAEVQQIASKVLRHGYSSYNPDDPDAGDNRTMLAEELGDLQYSILLMSMYDDVNRGRMTERVYVASQQKQQYLHFQRKELLGKLVDICRELALEDVD